VSDQDEPVTQPPDPDDTLILNENPDTPTLNVGRGPFPLSGRNIVPSSRPTPVGRRPRPLVTKGPDSMNDATTPSSSIKPRQLMRALPSPTMLAFIALALVALAHDSMLLKAAVMGLGVYGLVVNQVADRLDPECDVPDHTDCAACGDLPPLVPVAAFVRRFTRRAAR
jgi:hypothetical protein